MQDVEERGRSGERLIQRLNRIGIGAWRPGALLPFPEDSPALVTPVLPSPSDPRQARVRLPTYHEAIIRLAEEAVARKMAGRRRVAPPVDAPPAAAAAAVTPSQQEPAVPRTQRPELSEIFNVSTSQWDAIPLTQHDDAVIQVMMDLNDDVEADTIPQPAVAAAAPRAPTIPLPPLERFSTQDAASELPPTPVLVPATPQRAASLPHQPGDPMHDDGGVDPSVDIEW